MGRIKTALVKRVTFDLIKHYRERLSTDFSKNKEVLQDILDNPNKKLRNKIAGYATRLMKIPE